MATLEYNPEKRSLMLFIHLRAHGLTKGDEHPTDTLHGGMVLFTFVLNTALKLMVFRAHELNDCERCLPHYRVELEYLSHHYDRRLRDARLRMSTTTTTTWQQQQQQQQRRLATPAQNSLADDVTGRVTSVDVVKLQHRLFAQFYCLRQGGHVIVIVCLSVCLFVCPLATLRKNF